MTHRVVYYVLARNYREAVTWAREHDVNPRTQLRYVDREDKLAGVRLDEYTRLVELPGWEARFASPGELHYVTQLKAAGVEFCAGCGGREL